MQTTSRNSSAKSIPKQRQRHHSYDESVNEPARLIENEPVEIEAEIPVEENEPLEGARPEEKPAFPAFEDDELTK